MTRPNLSQELLGQPLTWENTQLSQPGTPKPVPRANDQALTCGNAAVPCPTYYVGGRPWDAARHDGGPAAPASRPERKTMKPTIGTILQFTPQRGIAHIHTDDGTT